jgi:hypothetical protein
MAKNTHLEHLEDDIVNSGKIGGFNAIKFLRELGKMLSEPTSSIRVTTKWDGAPAIVCGRTPENGAFFVGTKSVFAKTNPKLMFNNDMIDSVYNGNLATILKECLKYFSQLGITGVIQGDLLYTDKNKVIKSINNQQCVTFTPNTITYAIPVDSDIGKQIINSKIGIVFHTTYFGNSMQNMNATFGADVKNLKGTKDVYVSSATFEDASGAANLDTTELSKYNSLVNKAEGSLKQASTFLNEIKEFGQSKFMMNVMFKSFMNRFIRAGVPIRDAQSTSDLFVGFYSNQLDREIASKKTKSAKDKYIKMKSDGLQFLKTNSRSLYFTIASYMNLIEAKTFIIRKLELVKTLGTFLRTDTGYEVTAPEGFVAIKSGNALKLVDRLEFSRANFTAAKDWENG